ncbi:helix-turn-helix transcriptional regulator [Candidatus Saccharibacteria bacterium]|jgi:DNA-binding PadR family transcriptional regulator|nr:helix-turn-helix transcriptional regulator [Candidatus Saccharibacteria bacterium]
MTEEEEYLSELVISWQQNYKKSLTTLLLLMAVKEKQLWSKEIILKIDNISVGKIEIDEKSLYRALRRLEKLELVKHTTKKAEKTGAKRKFYKTTELGFKFIDSVNHILIDLTKIN